MTEEIIIDGVNVAGCEYCIENPLKNVQYSCNCRGYEKDNGLHIHLKCKDNHNCYYKQLKRLEQEKCKWQVEKDLLVAQNDGLRKCILMYEQERDELKQENERLKRSEDEWQHSAEYARMSMIKFQTALEEIRSAIIEYLPKKQGDYNFSKSLNPQQYALLEYIQLQIERVLGDENNNN